MSVHASVQAAHDALLETSAARAVHDPCPLCSAGTQVSAREGASVTDTAPAANVYSESQHLALLTSAVERETAALSEVKQSLETKVTTLESEKASMAGELKTANDRLDVLEAEKAAAEAKATETATEFEAFKADLAHQREVAEKRTARTERVKAANSALGEDYFSEGRVQRWAEMSDEDFNVLVADLTEAAAAAAKPVDTGQPKEQARETAAFTGGQTITSADGRSTISSFLDAMSGRRVSA